MKTPQTVSVAPVAQSTESPGGGDAQKTRTWPTPSPFSPREAVPSRHSGKVIQGGFEDVGREDRGDGLLESSPGGTMRSIFSFL